MHTHIDPQLMAAGEVVTAEIALAASATAFRPGDELHLVIRGRWPWASNPITGQFPTAYEPSPEGAVILHLGGATPARLLVPAISR